MPPAVHHPRAGELIQQLQLEPHPEGGWYREVYRSNMTVSSPVHRKARSAATQIYFLLTAGQISRLHRVCHDEIWHFYEGEGLELIQVDPDHIQMRRTELGATGNDRKRLHAVPAGYWQAARPLGAFALMGCTVAPGFDFLDFEFLADQAQSCQQLKTRLPDLEEFI